MLVLLFMILEGSDWCNRIELFIVVCCFVLLRRIFFLSIFQIFQEDAAKICKSLIRSKLFEIFLAIICDLSN